MVHLERNDSTVPPRSFSRFSDRTRTTCESSSSDRSSNSLNRVLSAPVSRTRVHAAHDPRKVFSPLALIPRACSRNERTDNEREDVVKEGAERRVTTGTFVAYPNTGRVHTDGPSLRFYPSEIESPTCIAHRRDEERITRSCLSPVLSLSLYLSIFFTYTCVYTRRLSRSFSFIFTVSLIEHARTVRLGCTRGRNERIARDVLARAGGSYRERTGTMRPMLSGERKRTKDVVSSRGALSRWKEREYGSSVPMQMRFNEIV